MFLVLVGEAIRLEPLLNALKGTIPQSIGQLTGLAGLELSNNALNGTVPAMNFSRITEGCYLTDGGGDLHNQFSCPLPPGAAEHCHGTCLGPSPAPTPATF